MVAVAETPRRYSNPVRECCRASQDLDRRSVDFTKAVFLKVPWWLWTRQEGSMCVEAGVEMRVSQHWRVLLRSGCVACSEATERDSMCPSRVMRRPFNTSLSGNKRQREGEQPAGQEEQGRGSDATGSGSRPALGSLAHGRAATATTPAVSWAWSHAAGPSRQHPNAPARRHR